MSNDSTTTIHGTFATRETAERAVEHLAQQYGIPRGDIFIEALGEANSAGISPSGPDLSSDAGQRGEPALSGQIRVSADVSKAKLRDADAALREAGALEVVTR